MGRRHKLHRFLCTFALLEMVAGGAADRPVLAQSSDIMPVSELEKNADNRTRMMRMAIKTPVGTSFKACSWAMDGDNISAKRALAHIHSKLALVSSRG